MKLIKLPIPNYLRKQQNFSISLLDKVDIECDDTKIANKIKSWMNIKIHTSIDLDEKPLKNDEE